MYDLLDEGIKLLEGKDYVTKALEFDIDVNQSFKVLLNGCQTTPGKYQGSV